jgi:hypothetical protein
MPGTGEMRIAFPLNEANYAVYERSTDWYDESTGVDLDAGSPARTGAGTKKSDISAGIISSLPGKKTNQEGDIR